MEITPKSPEPESETPTRIQPAKPISFSNGTIKRHHHNHHHHQITYKECLKNHAASIGGHALDGCGEFMPSPTSTPTDPTSLKCAACHCHRNFHRREPDDTLTLPPPLLPPSTTTTTTTAIEYQPHHRHHPPPPLPPRSPNSSSPPPISSSYMLLALSGTNKATNMPFSDLNFNHTSRKRFRTKFSQVQKEKMHEFADRIGWKIQKRDEEEVRGFCNEVGVDKGVLKVWMHNNKNNNNRNATTLNHHHVAVTDGVNNNGDGLAHDGGGGVRFESDSGGVDGGAVNASSSSS